MTFYEAAVEVLREAGRPLHFKKITEIAVRRELLSHVGKGPEATMGARLAQEVRKPVDETLIVCIRPGIFALRDGADVTTASETISPRRVAPTPALVEDAEQEDESISESMDGENASLPNESELAEMVAEAASSVEIAQENESELLEAFVEAPTDSVTSLDPTPVPARDSSDESDSEGEDDSSDDPFVEDEAAETTGAGDDKRGRRRRGRRGGRSRRPSTDGVGDAALPVAAHTEPNAPAPAAAQKNENFPPRTAQGPRPERDDRAKRDGFRSDGRFDGRIEARPDASPAESMQPTPLSREAQDELGDLARSAARHLADVHAKQATSASRVASLLANEKIGALGLLGTAALRDVLNNANHQRAQSGRPPLFDEQRPNFWTLAAASGAALAKSYDSLNDWQNNHRRTLRAALTQRLRALNGHGLGTLVTLLLDRLGYTDLRRHERIGPEMCTLSAVSPRGLTRVNVAIRLAAGQARISREDVQAFRGSLHLYSANEGIYLILGEFDASAQDEAIVPNLASIALIGPAELAEHMIRAGVGVGSFTVDVSCLNEEFFRELKPT